MDALLDVEWQAGFLEPRRDRELEAEIRGSLGVVPPALPYLVPCRWLARAALALNVRDQKLAHIDFDLVDLISLAVSQDNSCRYCYQSQRAQLRILGLDDDRLRRLEQASHFAESDPRERLALAFARRISRSNPAPAAADWLELRDAGYDEAAIREIALVACYTVTINRVSTLCAVPPDTAMEFTERWYVRLLRPLLARAFRAKDKRGRPTALSEAARRGPFAEIVNQLDGLPAAPGLRELLDDAWSSPVVERRAKALIWAVVAHGLGSQRLEDEALALLRAEGLEGQPARDVLAHLGGPGLDELEAAVVPFARETIRYRPDEIQRQSRALYERFPVEQFLECVGVASLANGLARLGLALEARPPRAA